MSYARKPESYLTIKEIVSSNKKPKNYLYITKNGIISSKIVFVALAEQVQLGKSASWARMVDSGRDILRVLAFNEDMPMVENIPKNKYCIITGSLKHDDTRDNFFVVPNHIEQIPEHQTAEFLRFWYLNIAYLRILEDKKIPKEPVGSILDKEGIKYKELDDGWIKIEAAERDAPRRIIKKKNKAMKAGEEDDKFTTYKKHTIDFLENEGGKVEYIDYISWATTKEGIDATTAEDIIMGLLNDGTIHDYGDDQMIKLK